MVCISLYYKPIENVNEEILHGSAFPFLNHVDNETVNKKTADKEGWLYFRL